MNKLNRYMDQLFVAELHRALSSCWERRPENAPVQLLYLDKPSVGQCAVTALVVQDYLGGDIVNVVATDQRFPSISISHYYNIINGEEIDLTRDQFRRKVKFSSPKPKLEGFASTRLYMLSYSSTVARYIKLKSKVDEFLSEI